MPRVSGNLLGLEVDGEFVSCETSCDFNYEVEMRGASAITSGRWKEVIPGLRSWTMAVNANLMLAAAGSNMDKILNSVLTGNIVELKFTTKASVVPELSIAGKAFVSSGGISAAAGSNSNWNTTFTGSGPFAYAAGSFNVGFGYSATDPFGHESSLTPQFFKDIGLTAMDLDFTTDSSGNYLFAKVPVGLQTVFTEWYNNMFNFGTIPDFVWRAPVTSGGFVYYISRDKLYITSSVTEIIFT